MLRKIKYGRAVIVGRPNTGKSTLLNALVNQKVAITSPLPQTTRKSSQVLYSDDKGKIIFVDTPGIINKVVDLVSKSVNNETPKVINGKDVIICMVDISRPKSEEENKVLGLVRKANAKKILVYNKIDKAIGSKDHLAEYNYLEDEFDKVISVSALKNKHVKGLINIIFDLLPSKVDKEIKRETELMMSINKPIIGMNSKEFVEEIIREKTYLFLREEIPYSINVVVEEIKKKSKLIYVKAFIFTNNERYKKIIIGQQGKKIKEIGYNARKELELMSGNQIYLDLEVKTDRHWMEKGLTEFSN